MTIKQQIFSRLQHQFATDAIEIVNESDQHRGHKNSPETGNSHFAVQVVSSKFENLRRIQRHQMVYAALAEFIPSPIHALKISARTPEEVR